MTPATALHNITNDCPEEVYDSSKIYTSTRPSKSFKIKFDEGGKILEPQDAFILYNESVLGFQYFTTLIELDFD